MTDKKDILACDIITSDLYGIFKVICCVNYIVLDNNKYSFSKISSKDMKKIK